MKKLKRKKVWIPLAAAVVLLLFIVLWLTKTIHINTPGGQKYPVRGVDVSEFQGKIDWLQLAGQDVAFAFIRATEGSGYTDATFADNFAEVQNTQLAFGAYHFFSFSSKGSTQAENFMAAVPAGVASLPPVVDVELYGEHRFSPPPAAEVKKELDTMLAVLEEHYGQKPILYTTQRAHRLYLQTGYEDYPLWIREVYLWPGRADGDKWTFWQYSDKGLLDGYTGPEKYIDLNVFYGSESQWQDFLAKGQP